MVDMTISYNKMLYDPYRNNYLFLFYQFFGVDVLKSALQVFKIIHCFFLEFAKLCQQDFCQHPHGDYFFLF